MFWDSYNINGMPFGVMAGKYINLSFEISNDVASWDIDKIHEIFEWASKNKEALEDYYVLSDCAFFSDRNATINGHNVIWLLPKIDLVLNSGIANEEDTAVLLRLKKECSEALSDKNKIKYLREEIAYNWRKIRKALIQRDGKEECQECGANERLEIDHIMPLTKGGDNSMDNLQLLCKSCNCRKGNRVIEKVHDGS